MRDQEVAAAAQPQAAAPYEAGPRGRELAGDQVAEHLAGPVVTSRSTVTSPPAASSARYLTRAVEPLWTVTALTTVVVRVSLVAGDDDGDGDGEARRESPPPLVVPSPEAAAGDHAATRQGRTAQIAATDGAGARDVECSSSASRRHPSTPP